MAVPGRDVRHYFNLVSRKAEEAALRRYQATHWLECLVGPLGIESQPSEKEFISCLRNGLILCNLINKIEPGSVPKVVQNQGSANYVTWDSLSLPAYQYFENLRNFLVAVEQLNLPAFEASIFERDNVEEGSAAKVVDCILALKAYHEWKQIPGKNGFHNYKPPRSPFVPHSSSRITNTQPPRILSSGSHRQLEMSTNCDKRSPPASENQELQDLIVKCLADHMIETKENMDNNLVASFRDGNKEAAKLLGRFVLGSLEQELQMKFPQLKSENLERLGSCIPEESTSTPLKTSTPRNQKSSRVCLHKGYCKHWTSVQMQEKELMSLKALLSEARQEFENLQIQLNCDLKKLVTQVQEMSLSAQKYHEVVRENWNLYNMVQDLKGNIRVYCRIRPQSESKNVIDFIGEDGSLVVIDPSESQKDRRKSFQFSRLFGPTASQEEVFKETQPLIRSAMDGYNVCIFAYGQTGSGKTHTMYGASGASTAEQGINYLALNDLFQLSNERKDIVNYKFYVQMVEIYNEQIYDLLAEDFSVNQLEIRGCSSDNDFPSNASMHRVMCTTDVISLIKFGEMNLASRAINDRSSRSHSVLTVHVRGEDVSRTIRQSCLHLVDLAGSEHIGKSGVTEEEEHINKSLTCLGDVIMALAQKNSYIPYRHSKLTLLLQNALGGHAKTLMFAHVSPEADSFGETMRTLRFAQKVSMVELGAASSQNKESNEVLELKAELESLQTALANRVPKSPLRNMMMPKEVVQTPKQKPKLLVENTPPTSRGISIENSSALKKVDRKNVEEKTGPKTPFTQAKSRRLSLEGPKYGKNKSPEQIKLIDPLRTPKVEVNHQPRRPSRSPVGGRIDIRTKETASQQQLQDGEPAKTNNFGCSSKDLNRPRPPPKSPTTTTTTSSNNSLKNVCMETKIPRLQQQPRTPEPVVKSRNNTLHKGMKKNQQHDNDGFSYSSSSTTQGKGGGSHIRKSLRSIGKLINGSEKRNQQQIIKLTEVVVVPVTPLHSSSSNIQEDPKSPISTTNNAKGLRRRSLTGALHSSISSSSIQDPKSPISATNNVKALRRQSLTGAAPGGVLPPERQRRSSLGGGIAADVNNNNNRNFSKTTPPSSSAHASNKLNKRWI